MSQLKYEEAKQAEGQDFFMVLDDGSRLPLILDSVKEGKRTPDFPGKTREPFSMFFKGTQGYYCPQDIYVLENETLGTQHIFLVPVDGDKETEIFTYQAIFN